MTAGRSMAHVAPSPTWSRWNVRLLAVFAPILIATGIRGLLAPGAPGPMSSAIPYDVFHIVFGALGLGLVLRRVPRGPARFNLGFGLVDLYQALAGALGLFPAHLFALRPGDHVVHLLLGALLVVVGGLGTTYDRCR